MYRNKTVVDNLLSKPMVIFTNSEKKTIKSNNQHIINSSTLKNSLNQAFKLILVELLKFSQIIPNFSIFNF